jgi:hypothetical protein
MPDNHKNLLSLQTNVSKICPALILAKRRKLRVMGRTLILTNSTTLKNGIKYLGVFIGRATETKESLTLVISNVEPQKNRATLKLIPTEVVKGNL